MEAIVWMPKAVKTRVGELLSRDLFLKIDTEEDFEDINQLWDFLREKGYTFVETWVELEIYEE